MVTNSGRDKYKLVDSSKRVVIILGGTPEEREYALKSADDIAQALERLGHQSFRIGFDKDISINLQNNNVEIAFIVDATFMGTEEEFTSFLNNQDLRQLLEKMRIPYTGSARAAAELAKNKVASKLAFLKNGLVTPNYEIVNLRASLRKEAERIASKLNFPLIVKPRDEGSSIGISIAKELQQFIDIVCKLRERFDHIFAEEYLSGMEATVPVLEIDGIPKPLAVVEINHRSEFYSSEIKLRDFRMANQGQGSSLFHVPARFEKNLYQRIQQTAVVAHNAIGCRGYSRVDMIIDSNNSQQILEINSLPVLESKDFVAWAARVEGIDYDKLIKEILKSALRNFHKKENGES